MGQRSRSRWNKVWMLETAHSGLVSAMSWKVLVGFSPNFDNRDKCIKFGGQKVSMSLWHNICLNHHCTYGGIQNLCKTCVEHCDGFWSVKEWQSEQMCFCLSPKLQQWVGGFVAAGKLFQARAAATGNARSQREERLVDATSSIVVLVECRAMYRYCWVLYENILCLSQTGSSSERMGMLDRIDSMESSEDISGGQGLERINSVRWFQYSDWSPGCQFCCFYRIVFLLWLTICQHHYFVNYQ